MLTFAAHSSQQLHIVGTLTLSSMQAHGQGFRWSMYTQRPRGTGVQLMSLNMFINVTNKEMAVRALLLGELLFLRIP